MIVYVFINLSYNPNLYCKVRYKKEEIIFLTLYTSLLGILIINPLLGSELNYLTK